MKRGHNKAKRPTAGTAPTNGTNKEINASTSPRGPPEPDHSVESLLQLVQDEEAHVRELRCGLKSVEDAVEGLRGERRAREAARDQVAREHRKEMAALLAELEAEREKLQEAKEQLRCTHQGYYPFMQEASLTLPSLPHLSRPLLPPTSPPPIDPNAMGWGEHAGRRVRMGRGARSAQHRRAGAAQAREGGEGGEGVGDGEEEGREEESRGGEEAGGGEGGDVAEEEKGEGQEAASEHDDQPNNHNNNNNKHAQGKHHAQSKHGKEADEDDEDDWLVIPHLAAQDQRTMEDLHRMLARLREQFADKEREGEGGGVARPRGVVAPVGGGELKHGEGELLLLDVLDGQIEHTKATTKRLKQAMKEITALLSEAVKHREDAKFLLSCQLDALQRENTNATPPLHHNPPAHEANHQRHADQPTRAALVSQLKHVLAERALFMETVKVLVRDLMAVACQSSEGQYKEWKQKTVALRQRLEKAFEELEGMLDTMPGV